MRIWIILLIILISMSDYVQRLATIIWLKMPVPKSLINKFLLNCQVWILFQPKFVSCWQATVLKLLYVLLNVVTTFSNFQEEFLINYTDYAHATSYIKPSKHDPYFDAKISVSLKKFGDEAVDWNKHFFSCYSIWKNEI